MVHWFRLLLRSCLLRLLRPLLAHACLGFLLTQQLGKVERSSKINQSECACAKFKRLAALALSRGVVVVLFTCFVQTAVEETQHTETLNL